MYEISKVLLMISTLLPIQLAPAHPGLVFDSAPSPCFFTRWLSGTARHARCANRLLLVYPIKTTLFIRMYNIYIYTYIYIYVEREREVSQNGGPQHGWFRMEKSTYSKGWFRGPPIFGHLHMVMSNPNHHLVGSFNSSGKHESQLGSLLRLDGEKDPFSKTIHHHPAILYHHFHIVIISSLSNIIAGGDFPKPSVISQFYNPHEL